jgi:hypothetical protein
VKEPTAKTWIAGCSVTFVISLLIDYAIGTGFGVREVFKTLSYSIVITTVGWLFALARFHRGVIKG